MYMAGLSATVHRYGIIQSTTGRVDSGACYMGCSPSNVNACRPAEYESEAAFRADATAHGEIPVILGSAVPDSPSWNNLQAMAFQACAEETSSIVTPPAPTPGPVTTIIGARPLPTTPTGINVPVSVYTPGTGPTVVQPGTAPSPEQSSFLPWIAAAAAALSLLG